MHQYLEYFTPDTEKLAGLGAVLLVSAALVAIGAVGGRRKRLFETDLVVGWALVSVAFVAGGAFLRIVFSPLATALAAAAAVALIYVAVRDRGRVEGDLLRMVALALPAIWLAGCMTISQWDEFTQWLPNARYVYTHNAFPGEGMPPTTSRLPAYPHGLAFIIYLSSLIAGHLVENASGVFSIVLLAMLGLTVARAIRKAITRRDPSKKIPLGLSAVPTGQLGWTYCALGGLAVTALNPTFVPKIVFTAYADTATAVLVGMLAALTWTLLNTLASEESEFSPRHLGWRIGLVAMALVSVKQANLALFLLVLAGAGIAALRDPAVSTRRLARSIAPGALLPIAMYVLWRLHLQLSGVTGEFSVYSPDQWLIGEIGNIAARMALIASHKGGYFGVMIVAVGFAIRALWRLRTPFDRLSLIVGVVFVGYTLFLLFAYVAAFGEYEALRAASYWRYNTHLGGACVLFAAFGIGLLWRQWITPRLRRNMGWVAITLMVAAPLAVAHKIRFDLRPAKMHVHAAAEDITTIVPKDARVVVLDLGGNGSFGVIANYVINRTADVVGQMTAASDTSEAGIRKYLEGTNPSFVWVHYPTPMARKALALPVPDGASHLAERTPDGWETVRSWPYDGYDNPYRLPD